MSPSSSIDQLQARVGELEASLHRQSLVQRHHILGMRVLEIVSGACGTTDVIPAILAATMEGTGLEAAAIRLRQGIDFPHHVALGFPETLLLQEDSVFARDREGRILLDPEGQPMGACLCGLVLSDRPDRSRVALTERGSFFTNHLTQAISNGELSAVPGLRSRCVLARYETFGLIPLRSGEATIGLLHLCDRRPDLLPPDTVRFLELLGVSVGIVLERRQSVEALRKAHGVLERKVEERTAELTALVEELRVENDARVRAETESRRISEEFEQIFNAAAGGMRIIDLDYNVVRANDTLAEITGYSRSEMEGRKCHETLAGDACGTDCCSMRRIQAGDPSLEVDVVKQTRSGRQFPCAVVARPYFDSTGRFVGIIEDLHDVTDRRRLESIAQAVNVMDNIQCAFAGIRHELGNPINSVNMALSVLKLKLDQFSRDTVIQYIDRALADARRVQDLLESLRSFSMFEQPYLQELDIGPFVDKLGALAFEDLHARGIHLDIVPRASADGALRVRADARALQQVFLNLLTNACDALAGRKDPAICVHVLRDGNLVKLEIDDNGCGMSARELSDLFKPFHTNKPKGTGLGLVIVKKMLAAMNATIDLTSVQGEGSRAVVSFPASDYRRTTRPPRY